MLSQLRHASNWPNGVCGCLLVSVGAYGCLRMPNGVCGCLLVSDGAYWCLWVPTVV